MTTTAPEPAVRRPTVRRRVTLVDLAWLTWRQHRWALLGTTAGTLLMCAWMLWNNHAIAEAFQRTCPGRHDCGQAPQLLATASTQLDAVAGFAGVIAVFWAAPLLAREYEQRTHLVVWGQDVSPARWFYGKVLVLGLASIVLALLLGFSASAVTTEFGALSPYGDNLYYGRHFEAFAPMQVLYTTFGFALGLTLSAWFRRLLPALAGTLVVFTGVRVLADTLRFDYLPPVRLIGPIKNAFTEPLGNHLLVDTGYADAQGRTVAWPRACDVSGNATEIGDHWIACVRQHGITQQYLDLQPAGRLITFRLIECGIFLALTVAFGTLAWLRVRRAE